MSFKPTDTQLLSWIREGETERDKHLPGHAAMKRRYCGPWYSTGLTKAEDGIQHENHEYEFMSLTLARLLGGGEPRMRCSSRAGAPQRQVAQAIEHGINRLIRDVKLRRRLLPVFQDMLMGWGVMLVANEDNPARKTGRDAKGNTVQPKRPIPSRLSPARCGWDPLALSFEDKRFAFHRWVMTREEMLELAEDEESGWDAKAVRELPSGTDNKALGRSDNAPSLDGIDEIDGWDIWVRDEELEGFSSDEGYNGVIHTIAAAVVDGKVEPRPVRKPRPYYGPPSGPYCFFGYLPVPDETFPLAPLVATKGQADSLNAFTGSAIRAAANRKRIGILEASDNDLKKIVSAKDGEWIPLPLFDRTKAQEYEIGGLTPQMLEAMSMERARLDRNSGIFEAQRGSVTGAATASENIIANEASSARFALLQQQADAGVLDLCMTLAWYLYHDERVVFPLGDDAARELADEAGVEGPVSGWFRGGTFEEPSDYTFEDLELDMEPYSLGRASEVLQQRRLGELDIVLGKIAPMLVQNPHVDADLTMSIVAEATNNPDYRKIVDVKVLKELQALMLQIQAAQAEPPQTGETSGSSPKLASDVPAVNTAKTPTPQPNGRAFGKPASKPQPVGAV